jgi:hypothetical protein
MPRGEIAGIAIGSVLGGAVVAILAFYLFHMLRRKRKSTIVQNQQPDHLPEAQDVSKLGEVQELPAAAVVQELSAN